MVSPASIPETFARIGLLAASSFVHFSLLLSVSAARELPIESNRITWPASVWRANTLVELDTEQPGSEALVARFLWPLCGLPLSTEF